jgi:hypothetical protein
MRRQVSGNRCQVGIDSYRVSAKKIFVFLLIGFVISFIFDLSLLPPVFASSADDAVKRLQDRYDGIQDMQGTFSQTSHLKDLERVETYEGEDGNIQSQGMRKLLSGTYMPGSIKNPRSRS